MGEAFLTRRGGSSKPKAPTNWAFLQMFNANGSFLMESGKWYRILCFGAGGVGGAGGWGAAYSYNGGSSGGGGGGSGGLAISRLLVSQNITVPITINSTITSFGSYLSAGSGAPGGGGVFADYNYNVGKHPPDAIGKGGASGNGIGGNEQNYSGASGGNGGISAQVGSSGKAATGSPGIQGGNSGMLGGGVQPSSSSSTPSVSNGGGGGGGQSPPSVYTGAAQNYVAGVGGNYLSTAYGFKLPITPQTYADTSYQRIFTYGGGGGAGGMVKEGGVPAGGLGSPGIIVIEKGVT